MRGQVQRPAHDVPGEVGGGRGVSVLHHTLEADRDPGSGVEDTGAQDGHTGERRGRASVRGHEGRHSLVLHLETEMSNKSFMTDTC